MGLFAAELIVSLNQRYPSHQLIERHQLLIQMPWKTHMTELSHEAAGAAVGHRPQSSRIRHPSQLSQKACSSRGVTPRLPESAEICVIIHQTGIDNFSCRISSTAIPFRQPWFPL